MFPNLLAAGIEDCALAARECAQPEATNGLTLY